jgi:hypothetical protein
VCFVVHKTISKLECVILTILFLPVQKTTIVGALGRGICSVLVKLTQDKAIQFEDLEFIADHTDKLSLLLEGGDSDAVFGSMASSRSPSLHAILEASPSEDDLLRACNAMISVIPIVTTLPSEETSAPQTIPVRPNRYNNTSP